MAQKILIVDDEQAILDMYKTTFERAGFDVQTADNGKQGYGLAKSFAPQVLLLDLSLADLEEEGGMSGEELLQELRVQEWGKDMKVIILTNTDRDNAPDSLTNLNISRYIVKVDETPNQVVELVQEVLGAN